MSIEERSPADALRAAVPKLFYFELDQSHRGDLGAGSLDLERLTRCAAEAGYRGIVGVEAFSRSRMAPDHADALARLTEAQARMEKDVPNRDGLGRSSLEISPLSLPLLAQ